jgi:hypothetical protein
MEGSIGACGHWFECGQGDSLKLRPLPSTEALLRQTDFVVKHQAQNRNTAAQRSLRSGQQNASSQTEQRER